jgi:hypothetical protein
MSVTTRATYVAPAEYAPPPLVSWRAVFAGGVIGLALFVLLSVLWLALGFASGTSSVRDNLAWFVGGSAIFSLFVGGLLTGWLSGIRGLGTGLVHGMTMWGILVIAVTVIGLPAAFRILNLTGLVSLRVGSGLWATFWSIVIALGAAGIGGLIGGVLPRRRMAVAATIVDDRRVADVREDTDTVDRDTVDRDTVVRSGP